MRHYAVSIDIDGDAASVWRVMRDVERWPEWTASVNRVRVLGGEPFRVGSRILIRQPRLPPAVWRVEEVEEDRGFTWVSRAPGVVVTARHVIEQDGDVSHVTLSIDYGGALGGLLGRMTRSLNERYIRMEAEGLKRRVEASGAA